MSSHAVADLSPTRLSHSSYDFADPSSNSKTAMEVADTVSDHFALARDNKLSQTQVNFFTAFLDEENVFKIVVIVIPEVALMAEQNSWVGPEEEKATCHILHAVAHLEPRSRRLSRPPEPSQVVNQDPICRAEELMRGVRGTATNESTPVRANGSNNMSESAPKSDRVGPTIRHEVEQMEAMGEIIRKRGNKGRENWMERFGTGFGIVQ